MCGIFGYIGKKDSLTTCIKGLKHLEYRGYDSAGIAGIYNGNIFHYKSSGKINVLEDYFNEKPIKLDLAIGHTRWATHGKPDNINAHPHLDANNTLAIVHNGIIENFSSLKKMLQEKNILFTSETDTEVVAQLIAYYYKDNFYAAIEKAFSHIKGTYAIAAIHKNHPNQIIAITKESPLAIGYNDDNSEILISSDPNAFFERSLNVIFLKNDEIAVISKNQIEIFHKNEKIQKTSQKLNGERNTYDKGDFEHFMLKEIYEQPFTIQKAMLGNYSDEFGTAEFEDLKVSTKELMATRHILIIACGTSWHAGCIAATMLEDKARIPTQCEIASEIRYKNPIISNETLVIAISQSGETADTIAAVKEAKAKGAKVIGICNVKNSALARESDSCIFLKAGPEFSVCSTKAFTSQLTVLSLFTLFMSRLRHMGKEEGQLFINEIKKVPTKVQQVLDNSNNIKKFSIKYSKYKNFFFLGRQYMYVTGLEAALKLKEISYLNANGYPAGELKHGPIALLDGNLPVIAFCSNTQTYDKLFSNLMEVKARGAPILAFACEDNQSIQEITDDVIYLPHSIDELAIFPSSVAGQLFAYHIAKEIGTEIDRPRNLAKSVTVE